MMYLVDRIGRKVMIATCPLGSAVCLFIYSGLVAVYADSDNQGMYSASVSAVVTCEGTWLITCLTFSWQSRSRRFPFHLFCCLPFRETITT